MFLMRNATSVYTSRGFRCLKDFTPSAHHGGMEDISEEPFAYGFYEGHLWPRIVTQGNEVIVL